jgi:hypothetical protein
VGRRAAWEGIWLGAYSWPGVPRGTPRVCRRRPSHSPATVVRGWGSEGEISNSTISNRRMEEGPHGMARRFRGRQTRMLRKGIGVDAGWQPSARGAWGGVGGASVKLQISVKRQFPTEETGSTAET